MLIDLTTDRHVPERLRDSLQRLLEYRLASRSDAIEMIEATLAKQHDTNQESWYTCNLQVTLTSGVELCTKMRGPNPNVCVADAASRLARSVARELKFTTSR